MLPTMKRLAAFGCGVGDEPVPTEYPVQQVDAYKALACRARERHLWSRSA
jgi:hypothetical protein